MDSRQKMSIKKDKTNLNIRNVIQSNYLGHFFLKLRYFINEKRYSESVFQKFYFYIKFVVK